MAKGGGEIGGRITWDINIKIKLTNNRINVRGKN
jgi:hypothetical protein